jgi:hypothetical protein
VRQSTIFECQEESSKISLKAGKMRGANFVRRSFLGADRKGRLNAMDRRDFVKTTSAVLAGTTLAPGLLAGNSVPAARNALGRMVFPINRNWRFNRAFVEGAHEREFDDSAFDRVVIPHTNVRLPWHSFDDKQHEFVSIYRRRFRLPAAARGKRVFFDFEGVMTASTVWINGVRLGEYKGGYTPFSFDLTPHIDFDGENVLAVDVDSTERPDIPPFGHQIDYLTLDSTRVVLRVTDEFGAIRPFVNDAIKLDLEGPAEIIGDNPFALIGGTGAIWIRAKEQPGTVRLTATHPQLGTQQLRIEIGASSREVV